jgi:hypothetical protein
VVGMPGCLPAVHRRSVSTIGCPPNPARRPGPGVQPSGVQPVQCPVIWLPGPDAAVRPAGVQPVRRPAVWCLSVRPVAAVSSRVRRVVAMGETSVRRAAVTTGSSRVPCGPAPSPAARSTARGAWMRAPLRSRVQAGGGASPADLGRVVLRREAAPERPGRPDRREGRLSLATALGRGSGWRDVAARHRAGGGHLGLEPRLRCVVIAEPDVRMDGSGRTKRARRRGRRAAPARPSQVANATGSTLATP